MAAKGIDRQMSIEDLVSDIDTYFREARETEYQRKKNDIIDNLRKSKVSIAEEDLARQAELVLTVPGLSFQVQGPIGERDEYIEYVNRQNSITQLTERKYLNLIIPGTREQRDYETRVDPQKHFYDEEMEVKKRVKANETFMTQLQKQLKGGSVEADTKVVRTKQELERAVTDFVIENKSAYRSLFITLNCHGGYERETNVVDGSFQDYGKLITHGEHCRTDDYIKLLNKVSQAHSIPIETLMGQCYSHLYDENTVSLQGNVTVYATTTADRPESTISIAPKASFSEEYQINIVNDIIYAEHLGFTKHAGDQPQPNPNLFPNQAAGKGPGQDPGGILAGGGVQPGLGAGDSQDMDTS